VIGKAARCCYTARPMDKARVLIVDDEQAARIGLSEIVTAWGYETRAAGDGLEAIEMASEFYPQAVITDVFMPRLDGFGLLKKLREEHPATAVILLTGQGPSKTRCGPSKKKARSIILKSRSIRNS
jgi:CheY-like chemotaxis protein